MRRPPTSRDAGAPPMRRRARIEDLSINKGIAITVATSGSLVAGRLAKRVPTSQLSRWFAYLLLSGAAYIVVHTLWTAFHAVCE